jgi:hypothetical protein
MQVDGISPFCREAGPADAPTVLLLYGFPSSRMYEPLLGMKREALSKLNRHANEGGTKKRFDTAEGSKDVLIQFPVKTGRRGTTEIS